jgi:signal transduction histidine kinase
LAQTSADGIDHKMNKLRIDELLWQVRDELLKHNPGYKIRIDLDHELDDESKLTIEGDEQLIKAVFLNLIDNGCKYSSENTIDVLIHSDRFGLTIHFEDKGIGIPPEDIQNIFEPFYRGRNTQNIKGHGIGLSMVKRIVHSHHGTIQLNSVLGKGTTVVVHFEALNRQ